VPVSIVDGSATRELRRAVLRPNWPLGSPMHGDDNPAAVHLAALEDGIVVGCCLILPRPYPIRPDRPGAWQLRGMAIVPDRQGHGLGARVMAAAVAEVLARGGRLLWCDARTSATRFYRQHGFVAEGAEFVHAESGIPHYRMRRELSAAEQAAIVGPGT
jgi:predicted GNAT family N-acyltransferase